MTKKIYLAGGCFWGVEKYFGLLKGVIETSVGYANGNTKNPIYQDVKTGLTGYAETVEVIFDDNIISLSEILNYYFLIIDPTSIDRQGDDIGNQYRTGIYYLDDNDQEIITLKLLELQKEIVDKVVIEQQKLVSYHLAEEYHQGYLNKNPEGYCHINNDKFLIAKNRK